MEPLESKAPHVLIFPLPAQGHVNSMLNLAQLLSLAGLNITFLKTDHNHNFLVLHSNILHRFACFPGFQFKSIPDGLPDDHPRAGVRFMEMFDSFELVTIKGGVRNFGLGRPSLNYLVVSHNSRKTQNVTYMFLCIGLINVIFIST